MIKAALCKREYICGQLYRREARDQEKGHAHFFGVNTEQVVLTVVPKDGLWPLVLAGCSRTA